MKPANPATTLDIFGARAVISGQDFRIQEFEATGTVLKQPFSVSVKLRTQEYLGGAMPSFEIEPGPGDVVLEGAAGDDPVTELLTTVLRELGRARRPLTRERGRHRDASAHEVLRARRRPRGAVARGRPG